MTDKNCYARLITNLKEVKSMSKKSTIEMVFTESRRLVEVGKKVLWEWVCEMQSELIVADAVSSRYRGKISCVSD